MLTAICVRLPGWMTPDRLTALGFTGALLVFGGYALSGMAPAWLWLALGGYAVHWFGDSLDGSLARHRGIERPLYGYFLDHSIDALGNLIGMIGLGLTRFVRMDVALFAVAGYMLLSIHVFLRVRVTGTMQLTFAAGGPSELRLGLAALTLGMILIGPIHPYGPGLSLYDMILLAGGAVFVILFAWHTIHIARALRARGE